MNLSNLCIRRPVLTIVINALVVIVGVWAGLALQVRQMPRLVMASVSVATVFPGAAPELVERQVTAPLEEAILAVPGIKSLTSTSRQDMSSIQVSFVAGVDPREAAEQVRAKVAEAQATLPPDTRPPAMAQAASDGQPVLYLSFADARRDPMEVTEAVRRDMLPLLATIPGVAQSQLVGERKYAIRLQLDPLRMAAYGITAEDVTRALTTQNLNVPGGQVHGPDQVLSVMVRTELGDPGAFESLLLRRGADGVPVHLSDIGRAVVGPDQATTAIRYAGRTAVAVGVLPQSDANPLEIGRAVREMLPQLRAAAPPGMDVAVAFDTSVFVQASVDEVFKAVVLAVALVLGVVVLFLGSLRTSLVALLTIPVSLIGAFAAMAAFGFSINVFSLLAMILAVGLVVDDAIVEVENVQRHVDAGMAPMDASFRGSEEVGFAVIATTITLASVFVPMGLAGGTTGQIIREFAFTLAAAILISGFVARTLAPMLCGRLVRPKRTRGWSYLVDRAMAGLEAGYGRLLRASLRARWAVGLVVVLCLAGAVMVAGRLPAEMTPREDDAYALIKLEGPQTASLEYLERWARGAEAAFHAEPEVADALVLLGTPLPNQVLCFVVFHDWSERSRTSAQITTSIMERLATMPGLAPSIYATDGLGAGGAGQAVQLVLKTAQDYDALAGAVEAVRSAAAASAQGAVRNLASDLAMGTPQLQVEVDRPFAEELGVPVSAVGGTIQALLGGNRASTFSYRGGIYNVVVELQADLQRERGVIDHIHVTGRAGKPIPLDALVRVTEAVGPAVLSRTDGMRSAKLGADPAPGLAVAEAAAELLRLARATVPAGVRVEFAGASRAAAEGAGGMAKVFVLALVFIYLVLSAQFESFRDPAIILLAVPMALAGALVGLEWMGGSLNIYSVIGLVTLIGLIAKHGILITEFANQLRDEGRGLEDAVVEAALLRLRPIVMTTVATVLGAVPLLMATGAGGASRAQIGMVIVAGMAFGTLVSLFVIPSVYSLLTRKRRQPLAPVPHAPEATTPAAVRLPPPRAAAAE